MLRTRVPGGNRESSHCPVAVEEKYPALGGQGPCGDRPEDDMARDHGPDRHVQAKLRDLEMTQAITYMVSGGRTPDPGKPLAADSHRTGDQIFPCLPEWHLEGKNGAPILGKFETWPPRLKKHFKPGHFPHTCFSCGPAGAHQPGSSNKRFRAWLAWRSRSNPIC